MQFFLLIFCALFGAAELLHLLYRALISAICRFSDTRGGKRNNRT